METTVSQAGYSLEYNALTLLTISSVFLTLTSVSLYLCVWTLCILSSREFCQLYPLVDFSIFERYFFLDTNDFPPPHSFMFDFQQFEHGMSTGVYLCVCS